MSTEISIKQLSQITEINNDDLLLVQTPNATNTLLFSNFVVGLNNTTFGSTITKNSTDIVSLSSNVPAYSQSILRQGNGSTNFKLGQDSTLVDVEVNSIPLKGSLTLSRPNSFIRIQTGLTCSLSSAIGASFVFQDSTDDSVYTEIDATKYQSATPGSNLKGTFVIADGTSNLTNPTSETYEILYKPGAVGANNTVYVKVSFRLKSGERVYFNRGTANNTQKGTGISYITLEEVFDTGNQSVTVIG